MPPRRLQILPLVYWVAVVGVFSLAAWLRFSLPLDPLADPDTWGYLAPALEKLTGGNFVHEGRNFVYPGFLFLLLRFFGDFRAITIAQHLLGLAAAGLLLLTWRRLRVFVANSCLSSFAHQNLGLVAGAIFLIAGEPIRAEMQIRPEGVCAFLLSLNLYLAIEFIARGFVEKVRPPIAFGISTAFTSVLLCSLRPSFIFLAFVPLLPLAVFLVRRGPFREKVWLAGGAAAGAILLLLPEHFFSRDDELAAAFLPTTLFVVHADLIRDQLGDDLSTAANLPYSREWLSRVHANLSAEIAKSTAAEPEHYLSLGFSPDYLMYNETSIAGRLLQESDYNFGAVTAFYRFYYWRTWQQRPLQMLRKIWRQLALFYQPVCPAFDQTKTIKLIPWYELAVSNLDRDPYRETWKLYPPAAVFMRRCEMLSQTAPSIEQRKAGRRTIVVVAVMYLPLLAIALILGTFALRWRSFRHRLGWLLMLTLFVFAYNAAACLEVAIINSLEVPRYSTVQFTVCLLAEFMAIWLVLEALFPQRRWGRPIQTSAPGE